MKQQKRIYNEWSYEEKLALIYNRKSVLFIYYNYLNKSFGIKLKEIKDEEGRLYHSHGSPLFPNINNNNIKKMGRGLLAPESSSKINKIMYFPGD